MDFRPGELVAVRAGSHWPELVGRIQMIHAQGIPIWLAVLDVDTGDVLGVPTTHVIGKLEYIDLGWCDNVSDLTLAMIAQHCPKLEELDVQECTAVTAVGLTYIATKCSKLKTVYAFYKEHILASLKELFPHVVWR